MTDSNNDRPNRDAELPLNAQLVLLVGMWTHQAKQYEAGAGAAWAEGTWGARLMTAKAEMLRNAARALIEVLD